MTLGVYDCVYFYVSLFEKLSILIYINKTWFLHFKSLILFGEDNIKSRSRKNDLNALANLRSSDSEL